MTVFFFVVSLASAGAPKRIVVPEQQVQASHIVEHGGLESGGYGGELEDHVGLDSGKGSNGAELSSLAHSSAIQAKNAVQNQHTAGSQAAFGVKSSLASAAVGVSIEYMSMVRFKKYYEHSMMN